MKKGWKYYLGLGAFIYCFIPLVTVELVAFLPLDSAQAVAFGAVYLASGEAAFVLALALLGKPFVTMLKEKVFGFFRRKPGPPQPVGRVRHRIGVALFIVSFVPYLAAELSLVIMAPQDINPRALLYALLAGDVLFLVSIPILGDPFWAKAKRLFSWETPGV